LRLRLAVAEAIEQGRADFVEPLLNEALEAHERLIEAASAAAESGQRTMGFAVGQVYAVLSRLQLCVPAELRKSELAGDPLAMLDDEREMAPTEIAVALSLESEALRKRLERWRGGAADGFTEVANPKPRQPRFKYRISAVRHILAEMLTEKSSDGEPASILSENGTNQTSILSDSGTNSGMNSGKLPIPTPNPIPFSPAPAGPNSFALSGTTCMMRPKSRTC
jgi:hypothetical protein